MSTPARPLVTRTRRGDQRLGLIVGSLGLALAVFSLTLDAFGGTEGFGRLQMIMLWSGLALISGGVAVVTPVGRGLLTDAIDLVRARRAEATGLVSVGAQLAVAFWLMAAYRIESPAFYGRVMPIVAGGFLIHHFLPARWRLDFFALLSITAITVVFGLEQGAWILGIGIALITMCHLPGPFAIRILLLMSAAGVLASMRLGWIPTPWSPAIWPIVGSMFMFRLIVYVYDLRHLKQRSGRSWPLAYFFCLPNVAFPLFPVLDFATLRRTYFDRPALEIYQQGMAWIYRGILHLIAYRLVYNYGLLSPSEVTSGPELVRYMLANFGLYLRVSGQFHLIVGLLHLFGFRLPETHRFFFLASSFTDFWRRINIYWKDFMEKVFWKPAYFRWKRRGETVALVGATLLVFAATWFFHSYQWFWLLGTWLWSATDTLFWAILAVLLVFSSLREVKKGRSRSLGDAASLSSRQALPLAARTAATFATLCLLWTLWTSPTLGEFASLMAAFSPLRAGDILAAALPLLVVGGLAVVTRYRPATMRSRPLASIAGQGGVLAVLWVAGTPGVGDVLPAEARGVLRDLRVVELNRHDQERLQRGYYENLAGVNRFNGELWRVYANDGKVGPDRVFLEDLGVIRHASDARQIELVPFAGTYFLGQPFRTNQWGMRDRDYDREREPGTHRIAVLGPSYVMGWGVGDGETFEAVLEDQLNQAPERYGATRYEILNFAVNDYGPFQHQHLLQSGHVFGFDVDVVLVVGHQMDLVFITDYIGNELRRQRPLGNDSIAAIVRAAGVTAQTGRSDRIRRLEPHRATIARILMRDMVALARERGITPVFAYIPTPSVRQHFADAPLLLEYARAEGFEVIDMRDVYRGHDEKALMTSDRDVHPNQEGHRIIAMRLLNELEKRPELLRRP